MATADDKLRRAALEAYIDPDDGEIDVDKLGEDLAEAKRDARRPRMRPDYSQGSTHGRRTPPASPEAVFARWWRQTSH